MCRRVLSYNVGGVAARSQGSQGFDALHRYIKQGKDFCRDFANILQERYVCGVGGLHVLECTYLCVECGCIGSTVELFVLLLRSGHITDRGILSVYYTRCGTQPFYYQMGCTCTL